VTQRVKLYPYKKITLKPRSETLIQVITNENKTGITKKEETAPGVYIGECLIDPRDFKGVVSVINTTDVPVEIKTPHMTLKHHRGRRRRGNKCHVRRRECRRTIANRKAREIVTITPHRASE
jgi:hypothetical protein